MQIRIARDLSVADTDQESRVELHNAESVMHINRLALVIEL